MRVALAALLFSEPDLLLLDEPSNHLDLEAAVWLESFLKAYRGSLIVVSHERDLLNNVADYILHVERGGLTLYRGNYDSFARQRTERAAQTEAMRSKQEAKAKKLQAYVDRWRYKAHTARQAQSRLKALAAMQPIAESVRDASVVFDFPSPKELKPPLVVLDGVAVGYVPGAPVLSHLNLRIDPDDRVALVGRNGNGKTTLARLLAGQLAPETGAHRRLRQIAGRLFRPASDRGAGCRRDAASAYAEPVAQRVSGRGARRSSAASAFPATRSMSRCASSRAASGRGCRSR